LVVGSFLLLSYWHKLSTSEIAGITSEMSGLATFLVGALVYYGHFWIATALSVASLFLLELKAVPSRRTFGPDFGGEAACCCPETRQDTASCQRVQQLRVAGLFAEIGADIKDRKEVGMIERRGRACLLREALETITICRVRDRAADARNRCT